MAGYSNAKYTQQQKSLKSYSKNAIGVKKASKKKKKKKKKEAILLILEMKSKSVAK